MRTRAVRRMGWALWVSAALAGTFVPARASARRHHHEEKHAASSGKHKTDKDAQSGDEGDKDSEKDNAGKDTDKDEAASEAQTDGAEQAAASTEPEAEVLKPTIPWSGLETDFRAGLAGGAGHIQGGTKLDAGLVLPLWLDVGYRIDKHWYAGAFAQVGFALQTRHACPVSDSCHATDYRFGAEGQYHFRPVKKLDPWVGLGFGYELYDVEGAVARGFELVNVQGGLLFRTSRRSGVGPFVAFTMGRFSKFGGVPVETSASHEWFMLGVHGAFWQPL